MENRRIEDEELANSLNTSSILNEATNLTKIIEDGTKLTNTIISSVTLLGVAIISFIAIKSNFIEKILGEVDKYTSGSPINTQGVHIGYGEKLNFDDALKIVLRSEGGLANQSDDKGGLTNKGITQAIYDAWRISKGLQKQSVKNMSDTEMRTIYYDNYWLASGADKENNPAMQLALFDSAVLYGVGKAKQWRKQSGGDFDKFIQLRQDYTDQIVSSDSSQEKFKKGWDSRTDYIAELGSVFQYEQQTKEESRPTVVNKTKAIAQGTSKEIFDTAKKFYGGVTQSSRRCAEAVHNILDKIGIGKFLNRRPTANDYIDELSKSKYFSEISKGSVKAGDIVIYAKSSKHQFGHIFISDGGLNSGISDFSGKQLKNPKEYGDIHVFRINEGKIKDVAMKNEVIANKPVQKVTPTKTKKVIKTTKKPTTVAVNSTNMGAILTGKEPMVARNT